MLKNQYDGYIPLAEIVDDENIADNSNNTSNYSTSRTASINGLEQLIINNLDDKEKEIMNGIFPTDDTSNNAKTDSLSNIDLSRLDRPDDKKSYDEYLNKLSELGIDEVRLDDKEICEGYLARVFFILLSRKEETASDILVNIFSNKIKDQYSNNKFGIDTLKLVFDEYLYKDIENFIQNETSRISWLYYRIDKNKTSRISWLYYIIYKKEADIDKILHDTQPDELILYVKNKAKALSYVLTEVFLNSQVNFIKHITSKINKSKINEISFKHKYPYQAVNGIFYQATQQISSICKFNDYYGHFKTVIEILENEHKKNNIELFRTIKNIFALYMGYNFSKNCSVNIFENVYHNHIKNKSLPIIVFNNLDNTEISINIKTMKYQRPYFLGSGNTIFLRSNIIFLRSNIISAIKFKNLEMINYFITNEYLKDENYIKDDKLLDLVLESNSIEVLNIIEKINGFKQRARDIEDKSFLLTKILKNDNIDINFMAEFVNFVDAVYLLEVNIGVSPKITPIIDMAKEKKMQEEKRQEKQNTCGISCNIS